MWSAYDESKLLIQKNIWMYSNVKYHNVSSVGLFCPCNPFGRLITHVAVATTVCPL
jgi:hypothetical protein